jgi:hypothetical protein
MHHTMKPMNKSSGRKLEHPKCEKKFFAIEYFLTNGN